MYSRYSVLSYNMVSGTGTGTLSQITAWNQVQGQVLYLVQGQTVS